MKLDLGATTRPPGATRAVTPVELFFDLVYVFAINQLAHHLLGDLSLRGAAETVVLTLAVVYGWFMTVWASNWLDPDRLAVRLLLVGLTFVSLVMSSSIAAAFGDRAWLFVAAYLTLMLGLAVFRVVAFRDHATGPHFVNTIAWELLAGALWVAGAVAVGGDARLALWGAAVAVALGGVAVLHWLPGRGRRFDVRHTGLAGEHLHERLRLFVLIALGETVFTTAYTFADVEVTAARLAALAAAFAGTAGLFWCWFQGADGAVLEATERADDPGERSIVGTWVMPLVVLALIAVAVADELTIAHPDDPVTFAAALLAFGGPALFFATQAWYLRGIPGARPRVRLLALGALGVAAGVTSQTTLLVALLCASAVIVAAAVADTRGRPA